MSKHNDSAGATDGKTQHLPELSSQWVGQSLPALEVRPEWRQTMNFAAALGDDNPMYFDDEQDICAPPMLAVALTWPLSANLTNHLADFPAAALARQVHYTEHLLFHRALRPLEPIRIDGRVAAITSHSAGTHLVLCYEARDEHEAPIFTEYTGTLLRGVACVDGGQGQQLLPDVTARRASHEFRFELNIDRMLPYVYDGCADIHFPIHSSPKFARSVGLDGIILQGTATLGLVARELVANAGAGDPRKLRELACCFTRPVYPGRTIEVFHSDARGARDGQEIGFEVRNHLGQTAIRSGYARFSEAT